ncbi:MAG: hypothetical protein ACRDVK_05320 [Acidimicrobiia bacterium]
MAPPGRSYGEVGEFSGPGWRSGPVWRATNFWRRWRGLRPIANNYGLWLTGRSVHGFGMTEILWVCGLDKTATVIGVKKLQPGSVVRIRRATSVLELPALRQPPDPGMVLTWIDAGDLDSLRDTDRQPG